MSLRWSIQDVRDFQSLWMPEDAQGNSNLNPITDALIWLTMAVGLGEITQRNLDEWCFRLAWLSLTGCEMIWENREHRNPTRSEVERHIGLRCNVSYEPRRTWLTRQQRILVQKAERRVRDEMESSLREPRTSEGVCDDAGIQHGSR